MNETSLVAVDPQALIAQAIDKGLPIETMERLLAMRKELKAEWARERYFAALSKFQSECPNILKAKEVKDKYGKHRYSYAPLDFIIGEVKEALARNGFSYTIIPTQTDKAVTSVCHSHHVDGHSETSSFTIPIDPEAYMNDSQKIASAMTYGKRYAFCNAFGIMTTDTDDDAQATGDTPNGNGKKVEPINATPPKPPAEDSTEYRALLLLIESADGQVDGGKLDILREAASKHKADAGWCSRAAMKLSDEMDRQEAILAANVKPDPTPEPIKAKDAVEQKEIF